jgi:hypothetical protein
VKTGRRAATCTNFCGIASNTAKSHFVHKKLRSAYHSIKRNMPWLWSFYDYPDLNIPNTNNGLEGQFTDLKQSCATTTDYLKTTGKSLLTNISEILLVKEVAGTGNLFNSILNFEH